MKKPSILFNEEGFSINRVYENEPLTLNGKKIIIVSPYERKNNVYKGQLHCHTSNSSDGVDSPSTLLNAYKNAGYSFVCITDHDYLTPEQSIGGILHIPSVEETSVDGHIISINVLSEKTENISQNIIDKNNVERAFSSMAHPNWSTLPYSKEKLVEIKNYNAIEVYNSLVSYEGDAEEKIDYVLKAGITSFLVASDDCHGISTQHFNKAWVNVYADNCDKESIIKSLKSGNFYSSIGADMDVLLEKNIITVTTSSNSTISFISGRGIVKTETNVTTSSYEIYGDEKYLRVKIVRNSDEKIAWSNPIQVFLVGHGGETTFIQSENSNIGNSINYVSHSSDFFRCNSAGDSGWRGTITAINGLNVTFTTTLGNSNTITPVSTTQLARMRIYNSSNNNSYGLIFNCVGNVITFASTPPSGWAVGHTITSISPIVSSGFHCDLEIVAGDFYNKTGAFFEVYISDSSGVGAIFYMHPYESYANSKQTQRFTQASTYNSSLVACKINQNLVSIGWNAVGPNTMNVILREAGY